MATRTPLRKGHKSAAMVDAKADPASEGGNRFSAVMAVFDNVDHAGDRIKAGAFAGSLGRWKAGGDPIPVVFAHQWDNPDAHVGAVLDAEELPAGHERLKGTELEDLGGLLVDFELYSGPGEEPAERLARRLEKRTIREFSFAYDVLNEAKGSDGVNDLLELEILEVGPTLKGMNPATRLLSQALGSDWDGLSPDELGHRVEAAIAGGKTDAKASVPVTFDGSVENDLEEFHGAAVAWAESIDAGAGGLYYVHQEATYPADLRAVVLVEGWDDEFGEGELYELSYTRNAETDALEVAEAVALEVEATVRPKARSLAHRAAARKMAGTEHGKPPSKAEDPARGKAEDEAVRTGHGDTSEAADALLLLQVAELS